MPLDYNLTLLLIIATVVILGILVLGGLVLSARSFTALLELIRSVGSLLVQLEQGRQQAQTSSSTKTGSDTSYVDLIDTPTTQG